MTEKDITQNNIFTKEDFSFAVTSGNLQVVKNLHNNKCPYDENICSLALENENYEILEWLVSEKYPVNNNLCKLAGVCADLDILFWIHNNDCQCDKDTCLYEIMKDNYEVMKWLKMRNYEWNRDSMIYGFRTLNDDLVLVGVESDDNVKNVYRVVLYDEKERSCSRTCNTDSCSIL